MKIKDYFENLEGGRKENKHLTIICKNLVSENQINDFYLEHTSCNQAHKEVRFIRQTENNFILCPHWYNIP